MTAATERLLGAVVIERTRLKGFPGLVRTVLDKASEVFAAFKAVPEGMDALEGWNDLVVGVLPPG